MGAIKTEKLAEPREAELEDWTERAIDYGGKAAHCKYAHRLDPDRESLPS